MSEKKVNKIFELMKLFVEKKTICKNGKIFNQQGIEVDHIENLDFNIRNLRRYLDEIEKSYSHIVKIKKSASHCYKLESTSEIFHKFLMHSEDISWLIQLIYESDKNLLNELAQESQERLNKISKDERDIFLFQGLPSNELQEPKQKDIFNMIKLAIKNNEYRDIHYDYNQLTVIKNVQCLKLLFIDSNWYVAIVSQKIGLSLLRMVFITDVEYSKKETYQLTQMTKYSEYLKNIQNPMTLYGVKKEKAYLLASPQIAKYFKPHMKKFLNSQQFLEEKEDGSVVFTLDYTQPIEILPFIKRWLPDIEIISPSSLQEIMVEDLRKYLKLS